MGSTTSLLWHPPWFAPPAERRHDHYYCSSAGVVCPRDGHSSATPARPTIATDRRPRRASDQSIGVLSYQCYPAGSPLRPSGPCAMLEPRPPHPRPGRGLPAQRRPLARPRHATKARPGLAQRPQARPRRHAPPGPRGRGTVELEELTARLLVEVDALQRDRGPARPAPGDRVLEGRARRADRGRPVRRRPQAPPAAGRLPVGAGRPADHLRPQALQRRARLPGAAGPRDQPLPQGAAPLRKDALAECTDEPEEHAGKRTRGPQPPANDDAPAHAETAVLTAQDASRNEPGPRALPPR